MALPLPLRYIRRLALALFPGFAKGDDTCDYFAFTINYEPGKDVALREHRDASTITLNVNLNSASQHYTGSGVEFVDEKDSTVRRVKLPPPPRIALSLSLSRGDIPGPCSGGLKPSVHRPFPRCLARRVIIRRRF